MPKEVLELKKFLQLVKENESDTVASNKMSNNLNLNTLYNCL